MINRGSISDFAFSPNGDEVAVSSRGGVEFWNTRDWSRTRVLTNFTAASEGVTTDKVVDKLLQTTPAREGELMKDPRFQKIFST